MKKIVLFVVLTLISISALALEMDERRRRIISIIDEELSEVSRLSKQSNHRNPDNLLRMAELNLEKARLWREKENEIYLKLSTSQRRKANKRTYFQKSNKFFEAANKICRVIVSRYKNYRNMPDVYYILGYNAKESGKDKSAAKYFSNATRGANKTAVKAKISLAELYYNKKMYRKAIPLYENALGRVKDRWWTKDSFNLAWCYYRAGKKTKGINKMIEVYNTSSNPKFANMRDQVTRDIGEFYATSGRIKEGINFYKKLNQNFSEKLIRIAVRLRKQGEYTSARQVLDHAAKYEKRDEKLAEIYLEQLALYEKFGKDYLHLGAARKLEVLFNKGILSENDTAVFRYQVEKQAARIQKSVASKTYAKLKKKRSSKANLATAYFKIAQTLSPDKGYEFSFYQGETAYAAGRHAQAIAFYSNAFNSAVKARNKKIMNLTMDGMLAALGHRRLSRKVKNNYYASVYERFLKYYPRDKKAKSIYQKLFKVYFDKGENAKAVALIERYANQNPSDYRTQEAMISTYMERLRKKGRNDEVRVWIASINAGKFKVSGKYASKLRELLTAMQMEDVQSANQKGEKKKALIGYHAVLDDPNSTKRSKIGAKYNLAALYYELGYVNEAYKWSKEAIDEMSVSDIKDFSESLLTISSFLFTMLEYEKSAHVAEKVLNKLCTTKSRRKFLAFQNSFNIYLADQKLKDAQRVIIKATKCRVPSRYILPSFIELANATVKNKNYRALKSYIENISKISLRHPELIRFKLIIAESELDIGDTVSARRYQQQAMNLYSHHKRKGTSLELQIVDEVAKIQTAGLETEMNKVISTQLSFPENTFRRVMVGKIQGGKNLKNRVNKIQGTGSGKAIVKGYSVLIKTYETLAKQVRSFTPEGKDANFIKRFRQDMEKTALGFSKAAMDARNTLNRIVNKNKILSKDFAKTANDIKFWPAKKAYLMDRGGK